MKVSEADKWFSKCVRMRDQWTCTSCGVYYPEGKRQGIHCSHFIGRANYATRFLGMNAWAHCYGCHSQFEQNPHDFVEWVKERLGPYQYNALIEIKNDMDRARRARREKKEIAAHYRSEHRRMEEEISQGVLHVRFADYE